MNWSKLMSIAVGVILCASLARGETTQRVAPISMHTEDKPEQQETMMLLPRPRSLTPVSIDTNAVLNLGSAAKATTVFSDDFGGSHPGSWSIGHDGGGGSYAWAWPNDYAYCYADPSGSEYWYPDDLHVYMERRNVSLAGYASATLSFYHAVDCEASWDYFTVNVRDQYGTWHEMFRVSGPTDPLEWTYEEIDLSQFAGQSGLYVQFRFDSDGSVSGDPYDGAHVENVTLTASSSGPTDDAYEENDTLATAYDFTSEQTWLSSIAGLGIQSDDDWYEISVSPAGYERVQVDCRFTDADGDIDIALYDAAGNRLADSTGTSDNEFIDYVVPSAGTYYIQVYYGDAGNSYDLWWDDIQPPVANPDLTVTSVDGPSSGVAGQTISITRTIRNNGPGDISGNYVVGLYLSANTTITTADTLLEQQTVTSGLGSDQSSTFTRTVTLPSGISGNYYIGAIADPNALIAEVNEDNNSGYDPDPILVTSGPDGICTRHAVVVGVADYVGTVNDLNYCDDDARDFRDALLRDSRWNTANINVLIDSQATRANIQVALQDMANAADGDDLCVFFFSGHGSTETDVAPLDETDGLDETICPHDLNDIRDDELSTWMASIPASTVAVFIDTCHSGGQIKQLGSGIKTINVDGPVPAKGDGFAADFIARTKDLDDLSFVVSTACDDDEFSQESGALANGVYTEFLLQAMDRALADANSNGELSCEEAHTYLAPLATDYNPNQHAQIHDGNGSPQAEYVTAGSGSGGTDDAYEPNNTLGTAYDFTSEQTWLSSIAGLGIQSDDDWYEISVSPAGYERVQVDCRFTDADGDIDIALYDAAGNRLDDSTGTSDNEFIDYVVPSAGTYYIQVYYADAGNTYDLWWDDLQANHSPTDIGLSSSTVPENQPSGTAVGTLSTADPDAGDTFTYSLVNGSGDTDNGSFTITGSTLQTAVSFNYEAKSSYSVRIRTTDQGGLWYEEAFTITINDVNEPAPTFEAPEMRSDGTTVLRWSSIANHLYTVHHSTNLLNGFTVLQGNIQGTPPINSYTDTVNNVQMKFWKITTEE